MPRAINYLTLVLVTFLASGAVVICDDHALLEITDESPTGISLRMLLPGDASRIEIDSEGKRSLHIANLPTSMTVGTPELPVLVTSAEIPDGVRLALSYRVGEERSLAGPPVRRVAATSGESLSSVTGDWPSARVEVEELRFREKRFARLLIYPARYRAATDEILLADRIDIRLDFVGEPAAEKRQVSTSSSRAAGPALPAVKIRVAQDGLVQVTHGELLNAGFDPSLVDPRNLELSFRGTPVPCRITGELDGSFDPADQLEFFGVSRKTRFADDRIYWLEEKTTAGLRFLTRDATPGIASVAPRLPATAHFEEGNTVYTFGKPAQEGDPHFFWAWFEDSTSPPRIKTLTHSATLPGVDPSGATATFRALFFGRTDVTADPDHRVRFLVNGTSIGESTWNGQTFHTAEIAFDPALLNAGNNTFTIKWVSIAFPDIYYMDWFEIDYPSAPAAINGNLLITAEGVGPQGFEISGFTASADPIILDVTDPLTPTLLTGVDASGTTYRFEDAAAAGRRYFLSDDGGRISAAELILDVPSNLESTANGADLLIIVPDGWESSLQPLVNHRQAQGLRVVLANLTDVADEFAGGNVDDLAIRDAVAWAYANWQPPALANLLLVGEPNVDGTNAAGESPYYHFMPSHFGVTSSQGETISDTWFGAVAGADPLPDVGVGRFSVRSAAAAADVAAKIIDYETNPPSGAAWGKHVIHVASDQSEFEVALEGAAAALPSQFTVGKEYRASGAGANSIRNAFNGGAVMSSFLGHGNYNFWADLSGPFYDNGDVNSLTNAGALPFVTALNCLNGSVGLHVAIDSMSEAFHNDPNNGALAIWSPAALGFLAPYDFLQRELYDTIFVDHAPDIGTATTLALVNTYLTQPISIDLVTEMILLGDPSGWLAIDVDDDQLLDREELNAGTDPGDRDSDDDGLIDSLEGTVDSDGDGMIDALDPDADNDGLPDGLEAGVTVADVDTDLSRGYFVADTDPTSITNPLAADTDAGGAPDGVEDANSNGQVDLGETDPEWLGDDVACTGGPVPAVAAVPHNQLIMGRSGSDVTLSWGDASQQEPCILYFVFGSSSLDNTTARTGFTLLGVTATPSFTDVDAAADPLARRYVIVGSTVTDGQGPWEHFEP